MLIGLERERNPAAKAGVRTFALVALAGTLAGALAIAVTALLYFKPELRGFYRFRPRAHDEDPFVDAARAVILIDTFTWPATYGAHPSPGPSPWIAPLARARSWSGAPLT